MQHRNGSRRAADAGEQSGWASIRPSTHNGSGESANLEEFVPAGRSLADHLTEQLHMAVPSQVERLIGVHLIHMVDEAGYLQGSLGRRRGQARRLDRRSSRACSATLQSFDPPGVFARDLAECLALQLKDRNRYDPQIAKLLDNLELLGRHDLAALKRVVGVDADELLEMITEIKALNPKPGLKLGSVQIQPVLPDVLVRPGPQWQLVGRAQQRHAAARAGQPQLLCRGHQDYPLRTPTRAICSTACRTPTGW